MKPLILVSNDDSISAKGVKCLIDCLLPYGDIIAVCPDTPHSGQSMALTINSPLRIISLPDYKGAKMYKVNGTPVDCIKLAMHHILPKMPDLVVAGINHGSNTSINVLYSGTMGAAMEGCVFGVPSIGFSLCDYSPDADFSICYPSVKTIVEGTLKKGLPEGVCLNVNIPKGPGFPSGIRLAEPCKGKWNDEYKEYVDPYGKKFYWMTGEFVNLEPEKENTDEWCLAHGFVSVVPVEINRYARQPFIPQPKT